MKKKKNKIKNTKIKKKKVKIPRKKYSKKTAKKTKNKKAKVKKKTKNKKAKVKQKTKNKKQKVKNSKQKIRKINKSIPNLNKNSKIVIIKIIRLIDNIKKKFVFNINIDQRLQNFFQGISDAVKNKIDNIKKIIEEEKERKRQDRIKKMQQEKIQAVKQSKINKQLALDTKEKELKEEIKFEKERKKELQKFVRLEQAEVRKEQADKQRKFLEGIRLEKRIEQFRKREAVEIKNLEKFVLSQERESYVGVQERIDKIKQKYQALRDQKIRERVEQLGITVKESDDRSILLEKERAYNLERQKIEFALESFFRSAHSLCFQINKRYIPKYLSIMRVIDRRFETGEIFIKWDDSLDEDWLILIYIKDNSPEKGIIIEFKTDPDKSSSHEFKTNEIFKASDMMVDALTSLLDKERKKRAAK